MNKEIVVDGITYVHKEEQVENKDIWFTYLSGYDSLSEALLFYPEELDGVELVVEDRAVAMYREGTFLYFKYKV